MPDSPDRWIVETDWLAARLDAPDLVVVDGSLHLPTAKRNAREEYKAAHIPGAYFFDIDAISDKSQSPPPYAAEPGAILIDDAQDGHRRWHARHRL